MPVICARYVAPFFLCSLLMVLATPGNAADASNTKRQYEVAPVPSWVRTQIPQLSGAAATEASDGVEYLALDRQTRLTAHGSDAYWRMVKRVVSETGVDEVSTMTIDFDPHADRVSLHSVMLRRGNRQVEQLGVARITVLRRESQLESGLLDGELTLSLVLEDVRPGDVIDYSYTTHHYDEVLGNRFFDTFTTQWSSPVKWSRLRLLQPQDRTLGIQQPET
ncbi:MAG TPA: DUF3857 domain-containing protein, partial [Povalibacter sp.]|nr:DUF3857 domain-containing protein [Povalibacter sp.]